MQDFDVELEVGRSRQEMPFPYVLDGPADLAMADVGSAEIARHFPTTELAYIGDEVADGFWIAALDEPRPLALFDGLRTDFSLARLAHYTGTPAEHVPAVHPVHQLPPLRRRVRPLGLRPAEGRTGPTRRCRRAGT